MPATLNSLLRKHVPGLHHFLKETLARTGLPVPKMLLGRPVWTHSQLLNRRLTEPHVFRWIADNLHPGDVFFDVGAHQGWMSIVAARKTGRAGRVVAFEPSPPSVEFLSYHKTVNRLSQLDIIPKAVTNRDDAGIPFYLVGDGNAFMNSLFGTDTPEISARGKSVIEIETITLDTFSRQSGLIPHLIKIDAEGAEIWVCEGAKHLLAHNHPALIIAIHPLWLPEGQKIEDMFKLLSSFGYRIVDSDIYKYNGADFGDYLFVAD
ncbi:FkbM family methyltransferase [Paracidobacterium acidisoli]|nr:FkbM family methyltransferase [Paracidobacterium acidisoli]MBT9331594.1 FkbM family methyltransferase [Paracidobacterium acidisoli]